MSSELNKTIRFTRDSGGTMDESPATSENPEFELVSTQMLEQILVAEDSTPKDRIRELADGDDGWLAQDTGSKDFEIVKDDELERALQSANENYQPQSVPDANFERVDASSDETSSDLCLVSTQHLRKVLSIEPDNEPADESSKPAVESQGFNPYNNA